MAITKPLIESDHPANTNEAFRFVDVVEED